MEIDPERLGHEPAPALDPAPHGWIQGGKLRPQGLIGDDDAVTGTFDNDGK